MVDAFRDDSGELKPRPASLLEGDAVEAVVYFDET